MCWLQLALQFPILTSCSSPFSSSQTIRSSQNKPATQSTNIHTPNFLTNGKCFPISCIISTFSVRNGLSTPSRRCSPIHSACILGLGSMYRRKNVAIGMCASLVQLSNAVHCCESLACTSAPHCSTRNCTTSKCLTAKWRGVIPFCNNHVSHIQHICEKGNQNGLLQ
jgi:hypothetical protein